MKSDAVFISIDPGRDKCGVAVLTAEGRILAQLVCPTKNVADEVGAFCQKWRAAFLVIGSGTNGKRLKKELLTKLPLKIHEIDEYKTTERARIKYWQANPPRGWRRFVPRGMLVPPEPVDDFAAVAIGERYLATAEGEHGDKNGK